MAHVIRVDMMQETATAEVREFYVRACCHWLIDQLPARAFPELVANLLTLREFYALPAPTEHPAAITQRPLTKITRVATREIELPDEE